MKKFGFEVFYELFDLLYHILCLYLDCVYVEFLTNGNCHKSLTLISSIILKSESE